MLVSFVFPESVLAAGCDAAAPIVIASNVIINIFLTRRLPLTLVTLINQGLSNRVNRVVASDKNGLDWKTFFILRKGGWGRFCYGNTFMQTNL